MIVSNSCKLILTNLYEYDFSSCFYNLLKTIGWDVSNIDSENKEKRNIQIGIIRKNNPDISKYLLSQTQTLIDYYISINNLSEKNIIVNQNDGIILDTQLKHIDSTLPLDFRNIINRLIISVDRNKILKINENGIIDVKGIIEKPMDITFYNMFGNISFHNTNKIIKGLENIRTIILSSDNIFWYCKEMNGKIYIPIKNEGVITLSKSCLSMIDKSEIDRRYTWNNYLWMFVQPILVSCLIK